MTWLGTSSGAPTPQRNVSSIAYRLPEGTFLVDAGEGTCRQARPDIQLSVYLEMLKLPKGVHWAYKTLPFLFC